MYSHNYTTIILKEQSKLSWLKRKSGAHALKSVRVGVLLLLPPLTHEVCKGCFPPQVFLPTVEELAHLLIQMHKITGENIVKLSVYSTFWKLD